MAPTSYIAVGETPASSAAPVAGRRLVVIVAAVVVALDQVSKWWAVRALARATHALGPVHLTLSHNRGAAFGLGAGAVPFVAAAAVVLVVVLVLMGGAATSRAGAVATGLLLGGALGNLADRVFRSPGLFRGAVVDFIDLRWWPVFNVADSAITIGCLLLLLGTRAGARHQPRQPGAVAP
jgi:signal peptidase II